MGRVILSQLKKVLITVPEPLLSEVDRICDSEKSNRSEFVREAMRCYLAEKQKMSNREQLKRGYQEMASINSDIADAFFEAESEALSVCEKNLAECEECGS